MPIDFEKLDDASATAETGELLQAVSWAKHLTKEEVESLHKRFLAISQAEDKERAILDNAFFFLQLGKIIMEKT